MKKLITLCLIGCLFYSFMHHSKNMYSGKHQLTIVTTTSMIADAVRNIVQDCAQVYQLMGPGVDPHMYRARESDVHKLADADIIFYNGLHLEGKMGQVLEGMYYFTKTAAAANGIDKSLLRLVDFEDMYDPHIWFDVSLWIKAVRFIQKNIMECDIENAQTYKNNGDEYIKKLEDLHIYIQTQMSTIPIERRILITAHDAFGYFGRAYGLEVVGLQGLSTDADISTKDIQQLSDYIVEKKVRAIFVESSIPQRSIVAVQNAVAARGWNVAIGDELYSDALGTPGTQAESYYGMVKYNVDVIINSLGG
jgi:manganese/zinc/iron transport system substrate-binding protein